ncbi:hypothetical protein FRC02_007496 [Tulasnella sp. 418]|nr:hypothetical protein FRC02_007496 [Tulasnella sp. 418]
MYGRVSISRLGKCQSWRRISTSAVVGHNPLGLPHSNRPPPPKIPTRGGPPIKRSIPHVKKVVAVASGKGGVGKSTVAVNLALSMALNHPTKTRPRVGILDLDIFGPSIPKLMGLENVPEPELTQAGALVPLSNHGLSCMSMGFLLPSSTTGSNADTPVVWRGLMVQKATQQLLFDVDWRGRDGAGVPELDLLVIDMPPGTGDVQLTLGQLVKVDGSVIVSTPQDVALVDARKGVAMFKKVDVPILGLLLNMSHYTCPSCTTPHRLFGSPESFRKAAADLSLDILGELPLVPQVSEGGDMGRPVMLLSEKQINSDLGAKEVTSVMKEVAQAVWRRIDSSA